MTQEGSLVLIVLITGVTLGAAGMYGCQSSGHGGPTTPAAGAHGDAPREYDPQRERRMRMGK